MWPMGADSGSLAGLSTRLIPVAPTAHAKGRPPQAAPSTLEQGVLPAMAVGDLERAKNTLGAMRRDSKIRTVAGLVSEIENDQRPGAPI